MQVELFSHCLQLIVVDVLVLGALLLLLSEGSCFFPLSVYAVFT